MLLSKKNDSFPLLEYMDEKIYERIFREKKKTF